MRNKKKQVKKYSIVLGTLVMGLFYLRDKVEINVTPSMDLGVYLEYKINENEIKKDDIVMFSIPETIKKEAIERGYIPKNVKSLMKVVKGTSGDLIEVKGNRLYINGDYVKEIYKTDSSGFPLPNIEGYHKILSEDELFVLGENKNSLDSAYFGEIKRKDVLRRTKPFLTFKDGSNNDILQKVQKES